MDIRSCDGLRDRRRLGAGRSGPCFDDMGQEPWVSSDWKPFDGVLWGSKVHRHGKLYQRHQPDWLELLRGQDQWAPQWQIPGTKNKNFLDKHCNLKEPSYLNGLPPTNCTIWYLTTYTTYLYDLPPPCHLIAFGTYLVCTRWFHLSHHEEVTLLVTSYMKAISCGNWKLWVDDSLFCAHCFFAFCTILRQN